MRPGRMLYLAYVGLSRLPLPSFTVRSDERPKPGDAAALEDKVTRMEDGYATICFATGMAAIAAVVQNRWPLRALAFDDFHIQAAASRAFASGR